MSWVDRANELLYDGETIAETVDVGANRVFVTSHRVLAFFPEGEGANFRQVDRPNFEGVTASDESDGGALAKAGVWGFLGVGSVVGGLVVEVGDVVSMPENLQGGAVGGTGGLVSTFETLVSVLALVDEGVALLGLVLLAVAGGYGYRYANSRQHVVTVDVAGEDDVRLVVDDDATTDAAATLRQALQRP